MINVLKKLSEDAKVHLWTIEAMAMNPLHELKEIGLEHQTNFTAVGEAYIIHKKLESSIKKIKNIQKYCLSEINGTFYNDFKKQYEGDEEVHSEYTTDTVYQYILGEWSWHPALEIDHTIIAFVEVRADFSTRMTEGIMKFFPTSGPFKQTTAGEMEKVSLLDSQIDNNLKAGSLLADIQDYNERIAKIKEIATNKGNLGEILNLISR